MLRESNTFGSGLYGTAQSENGQRNHTVPKPLYITLHNERRIESLSVLRESFRTNALYIPNEKFAFSGKIFTIFLLSKRKIVNVNKS